MINQKYGVRDKRNPLYQTYTSWSVMKRRCIDTNKEGYHRYGGRGIKVCDRWLGKNGFNNFVDDMGKRPKTKTLDRKDNSKDYTPENCKWSTRYEQTYNLSITRRFMGMTLGKYCKINNLNYSTVITRIRKGYTTEEAINPKFKAKIRYDSILVEGRPLKQYCRENNLNYALIRARYKNYGWSLERALSTSQNSITKYKINGISIRKYCKIHNLSYGTIHTRIRRGAKPEDAVKPPFGRWV